MNRPTAWDEEISRRGWTLPFNAAPSEADPPVTGSHSRPLAATAPSRPPRPRRLPVDPDETFPKTPKTPRPRRTPDLPGAVDNTRGMDHLLDHAYNAHRDGFSARWCETRARTPLGEHTGRTHHVHLVPARERLTRALADPAPESAVIALRFLGHRTEHENVLTTLFGDTAH